MGEGSGAPLQQAIKIIQDDRIPRRGFLEAVLGVGFLASLVAFLYPVLRYILPPPTLEAAADMVLAAKVGDLRPGNGKIFRFGSRPALLVCTADGAYHAVSAVCTHLGCTVQYRADLHNIWCACHGGMYTVDGANISGPPPRPLEKFDVVVKGQEIYVRRKNA